MRVGQRASRDMASQRIPAACKRGNAIKAYSSRAVHAARADQPPACLLLSPPLSRYASTTNTTNAVRYLRFHGADHVFHRLSSRPIKPGSTRLTWCEIPLSGCSYNPKSATAPWVCPPRRTGYTRSSNSSAWSSLFSSKVEMVVSRFDKGGIEFYTSRSSALLPQSPRVVGSVRHTWRDSPAGLVMATHSYIGLMAPGSVTTFDTSTLAASANALVRQGYLAGASNIPNGNLTALGWLNALHFLEEYAGTATWLPALYAGRTRR